MLRKKNILNLKQKKNEIVEIRGAEGLNYKIEEL